MGDAWMASASQISTWSRCKRKWYFEKVMKLFAPQHPSAELGERCHKALEIYIETGRKEADDDVMRILALVWDQPWLRRLVLDKRTQVEHKIENLFIGGIGLNGRIDLGYRSGAFPAGLNPIAEWSAIDIPEPDETGKTRVIIDHKSTSNFSYVKSQEIALEDPQTVVYGAAAFCDPTIEEVVFVYHYFRTKGPPILPRCVIVRHTRETLAPVLEKFAVFLDEMRQMRDLPLAAIPRNTDACWDFGGCHFRGQCFEEQENSLTEEQIMADTGFDFDALLAAQAAKGSGPVPAAAPAFVPPPVKPPEPKPESVKAQEPVKVPETNKPASPVVSLPTGFKPMFFCGTMVVGVHMVSIEEIAAPYAENWSKANKGVHYLNADFNKAERVIAVQIIADMARGELEIPPFVYIRTDSVIGKLVRNELYLLKDKIHVVVPTIA